VQHEDFSFVFKLHDVYRHINNLADRVGMTANMIEHIISRPSRKYFPHGRQLYFMSFECLFYWGKSLTGVSLNGVCFMFPQTMFGGIFLLGSAPWRDLGFNKV
jgi:hypothetical protein